MSLKQSEFAQTNKDGGYYLGPKCAWTTDKQFTLTIHTMAQTWEELTTFFSIMYYVIYNEDCIEVTKFKGLPIYFQFCQVMSLETLQVHNSHICTLIQDQS